MKRRLGKKPHMPVPKSKAHILKRLEAERKRLEQNLSRLTPNDLVQTGVVADWSIKDVLAHLADWEARMPVWIDQARRGDPVETPEPGLTWKQLHLLNRRIYEAHCRQSLDFVLEYFHTAHGRFMEFVEGMPEDEMLSPGRYAFLDKSTVYKWLSGYASHDLWAKTKIRQWMRAHHKGGF